MNGSNRVLLVVGGLALLLTAPPRTAGRQEPAAARPVNATSLRHKVLCGYQGWFRCPGDPAGRGWLHWGRDAKALTPANLTVEMWPDTSESGDDELYAAPGFTLPDGSPARLFSSARPKTVERHFRWMQQYGIDGAFVQRFLVNLGDPSFDRVLAHCRAAAEKTGRAYAVCYDLTGTPPDRLYDRLTRDWVRLVDDDKVTRDGRYLHHGGKPVVFVWGFFSDRFEAALAHRVIDFFKQDGKYGATLVGGCQWYWRTEKNAEWARAFRRLDVISPWNVGNVTVQGGKKYAATGYWRDDAAEARRAGAVYLPVVYPGFGWTNLRGPGAARDTIPRLGGEFYWRQFAAAADVGAEAAYVAMFDEVDEATAIFKVTNAPPTQARFATYDGLPSDWYLRLTGEGARVIRGERPAGAGLPIRP